MHVSIVQYFVQPTLTLSLSDIFERATWQPYSHFQWQHPATLTNHRLQVSSGKGPSIYDVHTEGGGGSGSCGRGEGVQPHVDVHTESTDVILSSSHAKKLASFLPESRLWTEKKWKFFCDIN